MSNNIFAISIMIVKNSNFANIKNNKPMKTTILAIGILLVSVLSFAQDELNPEKQSDIIFKTTVYDFGEIPFGEEAKYNFVFKNISKAPIALTNVKASCGCTSPEWSKEPIAKRKKGSITITYDTKRTGNFNKTIYVYTNNSEQPVLLRVKGTVLNPDDNNVVNGETKKHEQNSKKATLQKVESKSFQKSQKGNNNK